MHKLVLLRHGESVWNRENRFTGWTDVDLADLGLAEAQEAGRLLKEGGFVFDVAYTSVLKRAIRTLGWRFSADRMVKDYLLKAYISAAGGTSSDVSRT